MVTWLIETISHCKHYFLLTFHKPIKKYIKATTWINGYLVNRFVILYLFELSLICFSEDEDMETGAPDVGSGDEKSGGADKHKKKKKVSSRSNTSRSNIMNIH